ncbi:glycosyltransferase family 4 protein [Arthrobacter tumbae]|uniref:glycosyltransferase family 1 protein n=1 Tax=Arthrobacter tumbae TaxID=163874 RepID=UPI001957E998|nr:glycosyltransferase family 1 protein [Arthrobacter tumbae]MBM7780114.1 hypothetical protein [Arthrobacter tumbae]
MTNEKEINPSMLTDNNKGTRLRVLVLSFSPIIRDPRVLRQVRLFEEVADVTTCGYGEAPSGVVEHIEVPAHLAGWRSDFKKTALLLGLRRHEQLYFGSERIRYVQDRIPEGKFDVIFANDALAVPAAISLKPRLGVHADLHEYAPRQGEDRLQWRLLIGPLMNWACKHYVTKANSVSTVAHGIAEEYAKVYGIDRPVVVPNASAYEPSLSPVRTQAPLRVVHAGAAARARRIEVMIDAVARANELKPGTATFDVVLVPGDQKYIDELKRRAESKGDGSIRVLPPVGFKEIVPMLHQYDIGFYLCPPLNFNMMHALPNKIFEYVQARLAVLIGPSPEMKRLVEEHNIGSVCSSFDADSAAHELLNLSPSQVDVLKRNAHEAAASLNAESLTKPWLEALSVLTR